MADRYTIKGQHSNTTLVTVQQQKIAALKMAAAIQIQHLLLFNLSDCNNCLCDANSNTTLVTVQRRFSCYRNGGSIIQIQHLLLFNILKMSPATVNAQFKYNTCYCSTVLYQTRRLHRGHSNTTLVTVQPT